MVFLAIKLALFGVGWLLGRAAIRAAERAGALDRGHARTVLHAALAVVVALFWFPELAWAARHPGEVAGALGVLALTALPVGGFVLFLRWAHRRAAARQGGQEWGGGE